MRFKRLLALLLAAALALAVLVGCGGGQQSAAQALLKLLDGKYPNLSIEIDPDLEAALRKAVSQAETEEEIRAALEEILGPGINFRLLGDGQKGDSAWNLILYPGSDPDAAARSAYLEWDKIFSAFPSSGLYTAKLSMIETDNGYAILVQATVDKTASRNDDDDDEPEEPEDPGYTDDGKGNYTVTTAHGLEAVAELVNNGETDIDITLTGNIDLTGETWTPIGDGSTYQGTFDGRGHSITGLNASSLFGDIGKNATVKNLQLVDVKLNESSGATAGIVANNYGTIMACSMTGKISAYSYTSGIANFNSGKIVACWFSGTLKENEGYGIVAFNYGTITACFWDGNTTNGYRSNEGGTVDATKVNDGDSWQTAVDGMNAALTGNDYQWKLGANSLPVLQRNQ